MTGRAERYDGVDEGRGWGGYGGWYAVATEKREDASRRALTEGDGMALSGCGNGSGRAKEFDVRRGSLCIYT